MLISYIVIVFILHLIHLIIHLSKLSLVCFLIHINILLIV